jgi:hypothetical protein
MGGREFVNCLGSEQEEVGSVERVRTYSNTPSSREYVQKEERVRERRIPRTSHQVVDKMQRLADRDHGGLLRDNVMEIFEQLHPVDRQTFLKKSLLLHWENDIDRAVEALEDIKVDKETSIDMGVVQHERKDLRSIDAEEQIKLKTWMNKAFLIIGSSTFILVVLFTLVMGAAGSEKGSTLMDTLLSIFELVKG